MDNIEAWDKRELAHAMEQRKTVAERPNMPKVKKVPTRFSMEPHTSKIQVLIPGRAEAVKVEVPTKGFFSGIQVFNGFGGENQITVITTWRQDLKCSVVVVHSQVDGDSEVVLDKLVTEKEFSFQVLGVINGLWA